MFKVLWRRFRAWVQSFGFRLRSLELQFPDCVGHGVVGWNTGGLVASTMVPFSIPQTTNCRMFRVASKKADCSENLASADDGAS